MLNDHYYYIIIIIYYYYWQFVLSQLLFRRSYMNKYLFVPNFSCPLEQAGLSTLLNDTTEKKSTGLGLEPAITRSWFRRSTNWAISV